MTPNEMFNKYLKRPVITSPTTQQVVKVVASIESTDVEEAVKAAKKASLQWITRRAGELPPEAWDGNSFELDGAGTLASAVQLPNQSYWVARLNDPDQQVPGRIWSTEITVASSGKDSIFGVRLMVSTRVGHPSFTPSVPGVVKQLSNTTTLVQDGILVSDRPWIIQSDEEIEALVELIQNPNRSKPIYAVSLAQGIHQPQQAVIDGSVLSKRCLGIAHVVIIPDSQTYHLSKLLGKHYSVFNGAVRTYMPSFIIGETFPEAHPVALQHTILNWGPRGKTDFSEFLIQKAADHSLSRITETDLPRLSTVKTIQRQLTAHRTTTHTGNYDEQLDSLTTENTELKEDCKFWEESALETEAQKNAAMVELEESRAEQAKLRTRIFLLEDRLKQENGKDLREEIPIPKSLENLSEWANQYLAGKMILTKRAMRSSKNIQYENSELAYKALLTLGHDYRRMRQGLIDKTTFDQALAELGLSSRPCFTNGEAGAKIYGDEYYAQYNGHNRYLEWHLKNNANTRDPLRCLRIYYFWDPESLQVVVGSLPKHLPMKAS